MKDLLVKLLLLVSICTPLGLVLYSGLLLFTYTDNQGVQEEIDMFSEEVNSKLVDMKVLRIALSIALSVSAFFTYVLIIGL